jgi:hypothetical protein
MQRPEGHHISAQKALSLAQTEEKLQVSLKDAFAFAETLPHPRLWRLLAHEALKQRNFQLAVRAFVLRDDYKSVQFVKQVSITQLSSLWHSHAQREST